MNVRALTRACIATLALACGGTALATPAPFDLSGPKVDVIVTRGAQILPASEVPNLAVGDKLWIKADLPATQSAHYLMVAAFLSGSTNPPPEDWFYPCKTWTGSCARDGLTVTVPKGAQQVLVFFAPETGGDLRTLVSAVRGRPGAFVRASQDLNQAALDRGRLERYLTTVRMLDHTAPQSLKETAPLLARSLGIKVDEKCLDRLPELQAPCLMSGQESLILNDGHTTTIVEALAASPGTDLVMEASLTPQLGYGFYSPYIASVVDIARILDSFRTAQYQYIPALATQRGDSLALTLNAAPSFNNPKSVLVVGLPAVEQAQPPPLHAVDPTEIYCASRNSLVLPVEGAPLVFSTGYAHDIVLSVRGKDGKTIDLPARADGTQGGYVVDTSRLQGASLGETVHASLQGYWGFEPYAGPSFQLRNTHAKSWTLADGDQDALIVGRQDTVHLRADSVSCVDTIMLRDPAGKELKADWKRVKPDEVEVKLPLESAQPGAMTLLVQQYGSKDSLPVPIQTFSDAGHYDGFAMHAGDAQGVLSGSRLDLVASLSIGSLMFTPGDLSSQHGNDTLIMQAQDPQAAAALKQARALPAKLALKDGRVLSLNAAVDSPRPRVQLIGKSVQPSQSSGASNIELADPDELPQDARLSFSLRALTPASFAADEVLEVATADGAFTTQLGVRVGGLQLVDSHVAVATLDPTKAFGSSAFGPLQFRVLAGGVAGDWQPLATLVRLPALSDLKCPAAPELACKLGGRNLFLIDAVAGDPQFKRSVQVQEGFPGYVLQVPQPSNGRLYLRLRDDPSIINQVALQPQPLPVSPDAAARALSGGDGSGDAAPANSSPASPSASPSAPAAAGSAAPAQAAPASTPSSMLSPSPASDSKSLASSHATAAPVAGPDANAGAVATAAATPIPTPTPTAIAPVTASVTASVAAPAGPATPSLPSADVPASATPAVATLPTATASAGAPSAQP